MLKIVVPSEISPPKVIEMDYTDELDHKLVNIVKKMLFTAGENEYLIGVRNMQVFQDGVLLKQFGTEVVSNSNNVNKKTSNQSTTPKPVPLNSNTIKEELTKDDLEDIVNVSSKAEKVQSFLLETKTKLTEIYQRKEDLENEIKKLIISIKDWVSIYEPLIK